MLCLAGVIANHGRHIKKSISVCTRVGLRLGLGFVGNVGRGRPHCARNNPIGPNGITSTLILGSLQPHSYKRLSTPDQL